jgi:hypothetical protein
LKGLASPQVENHRRPFKLSINLNTVEWTVCRVEVQFIELCVMR